MNRFLKSLLSQNRIVGGAAVLAITQLLASIAGLLRDRLLAVVFPVTESGVFDVYVAAFRPSDLLFQICIMSALGTILVPLLAGHKAHDRRGDVSRVLSGTMVMGGMIFASLALFLAVGFPWIAHWFVEFTGDKLALYIRFGQIALVINFLFVFGNALGQLLITEQRYWVYGFTPVIYTLCTIAGTWFLTPYIGSYGPMIGTLIGAVLYVVVRVGGALRIGYRFEWSGLKHPELKQMGILMLPRMLALGALQIQLLLFDTIGSGLPQGSIVINYASRNFQGLIVGVAGIALAQSLYSLLGQAAAKHDLKRFRAYVEGGTGMMLLLTVPASILLVLVAPIAAGLVHLSDVYEPFKFCLLLYAVSVPFESCAHLLLRAFYSLKDTVIPAVLGVLSGVGSVAVAWWLIPRFGVAALPMGYLVGQGSETVLLMILLYWRLNREEARHVIHSAVI